MLHCWIIMLSSPTIDRTVQIDSDLGPYPKLSIPGTDRTTLPERSRTTVAVYCSLSCSMRSKRFARLQTHDGRLGTLDSERANHRLLGENRRPSNRFVARRFVMIRCAW